MPGTIFRGDTYKGNGVVLVNGLPADITGWRLWLTVKTSPDDSENDTGSETLFKADTEDGSGNLEITSATAGAFSWRIPGSASDALTSRAELVFDIQAEDTLGDIATLKKDTITVVRDVTRRTT